MIARLRQRARWLKTWVRTLSLAYRDPRVPWHARAVALCVVAYAFSPIDLIPDFVPVLGYLDDLVLLPLGIALALRLIPSDVLAECRERAAAEAESPRPTNWTAATVIIAMWLVLAGLGVAVGVRLLR